MKVLTECTGKIGRLDTGQVDKKHAEITHVLIWTMWKLAESLYPTQVE